MSKPSQPAAPDYKGAATAQGQANIDTAKVNAQMGMVNQNTPWGTQTYSKDPNSPAGYASTINLAPDQQNLLNQQNSISNTLGGLAQGYAGQAGSAASNPLDPSQLNGISAGPQSGDFSGLTSKAYSDLMSRQNQNFDQQDQALQQQLANQGLSPGSEAYNRAYQPLNQARVDASNQADLASHQLENQYFNQGQAAAGMGNQANAQQLQQQAFLQSNPLNQLNALRSGSQVQAPSFQTYGQGNAQAAPLFNATQAQGQWDQNMYNSQTGSSNNMLSGLFGLGSSAFGAAGNAGGFSNLFSDRRLKRNIERIGVSPRGYPWYRFEYIWGQKSEGVMADEVHASAITRDSSGFDKVDYSQV